MSSRRSFWNSGVFAYLASLTTARLHDGISSKAGGGGLVGDLFFNRPNKGSKATVDGELVYIPDSSGALVSPETSDELARHHRAAARRSPPRSVVPPASKQSHRSPPRGLPPEHNQDQTMVSIGFSSYHPVVRGQIAQNIPGHTYPRTHFGAMCDAMCRVSVCVSAAVCVCDALSCWLCLLDMIVEGLYTSPRTTVKILQGHDSRGIFIHADHWVIA